MLLDENARLSARVFGDVLNYPLYDAECCPTAREFLALGNISGAIAEWQRLAGLGSGSARCVLAYLHLVGAPTIPVDLEEARRIALSAVRGARGYANYLLGCIALREKQPAEAGKYLVESIKAGFMPAATLLASLSLLGASPDAKRKALDLLRKSAASGHCPARLRLAGVYLSGQLGLTKRVVGLALLVPAFVRLWLAIKYQTFSIHCFQAMSTPSKRGLFSEHAIEGVQPSETVAARVGRRVILRWTHAVAAFTAAVVIGHSEPFARQGGAASPLAMVGWGLIAALPYGFSYWVASTLNTRTFISTLVQTISLCVVTLLVCSGYLGELFDSTLSTWNLVVVATAQMFLLFVACGLGETAAQQLEADDVSASPGRNRLIWVHAILGIVAGGSWLARSTIWRFDYWRDNGFNLASYILLATLPYTASAVLAWRLVTPNRWKPLVYVLVLILGTALAVANNSGIWIIQPGILGVFAVLMVQFIGFMLAAEWALERTEG
jgi:hypothetical protein